VSEQATVSPLDKAILPLSGKHAQDPCVRSFMTAVLCIVLGAAPGLSCAELPAAHPLGRPEVVRARGGNVDNYRFQGPFHEIGIGDILPGARGDLRRRPLGGVLQYA
jgi:hypothetical protein